MEKLNNLEEEIKNLSEKIAQARIELEILKIDGFYSREIKLLEEQIPAMYEYLDKLILRFSIIKNRYIKSPQYFHNGGL